MPRPRALHSFRAVRLSRRLLPRALHSSRSAQLFRRSIAACQGPAQRRKRNLAEAHLSAKIVWDNGNDHSIDGRFAASHEEGVPRSTAVQSATQAPTAPQPALLSAIRATRMLRPGGWSPARAQGRDLSECVLLLGLRDDSGKPPEANPQPGSPSGAHRGSPAPPAASPPPRAGPPERPTPVRMACTAAPRASGTALLSAQESSTPPP
mmetsp:Transcript_19436/g.46855  ORF Transcript_19436/g.46855 Transcript_19436/m.46855 type:complete len:208 (+) Transcript_19436:3-626(+)